MANASASPFGWDFQFNSAVVLFLDNIRDVVSIRVEGKTEDIELNLNDGKKIFAQCKSCYTDEYETAFSSKLSDAFETLNVANDDPNCIELLYVTNNPMPLGKTNRDDFSSNDFIVKFVDLSKNSQQYIFNLIKKKKLSLDPNKLSIRIIGFTKGLEGRHSIIKQHLREFLGTINAEYYGSIDQLHRKLCEEMSDNSTTPVEVSIDKKEIICIFVRNNIKKEDKYTDNLNLSDYTSFHSKFDSIIEQKTIDYTFISKVFYDYTELDEEHRKTTGKKYPEEKYIDEHWTDSQDQFDIQQTSEECKEALIKTVLYTLFKRKREFEELKKAANL